MGANKVADVDIRLERGAAVGGTIRFDDGTPASDVQLELLHKSKDQWVGSLRTGFISRPNLQTDDLGHYRISGLRGREYLLEVVLSRVDTHASNARRGVLVGTGWSSLIIYSGGATRRSDAVPLKLGAGEERSGEDITIPLGKLHFVGGIVTAAQDGHTLKSGSLEILDPENKERVVSSQISNDGTLRLDWVPEGSYLLQVDHANDASLDEQIAAGSDYDPRSTHQYGEFDQPIKIEGDLTNLVLAVPEAKTEAIPEAKNPRAPRSHNAARKRGTNNARPSLFINHGPDELSPCCRSLQPLL